MSEPTNDDGWIVHDGGPCPAPLEARVSVRFRDGVMVDDEVAEFWTGAGYDNGQDWWRWEGPGPAFNIVSYKVLRLLEPDPRDARIAELTAERDALAAQVEMLRQCLAFYAQPHVYEPHPHGPAFDRRDLSGPAIIYLDATAPRPAPVIVEE